MVIQDTNGEINNGLLRPTRLNQYRDLDVAMICASANNLDSFDQIKDWVTEIDSVPSALGKPKILILTKIDTPEHEVQVTEAQIKAEASEQGFALCCFTSSKENSNSQVQKAFVSAIRAGYMFKYEDDL